MRILFVGVFDNSFRSTNTSQLLSFKQLGYDVVGYNYRDKALQIGAMQRDKHLVETVASGKFDLVVYSKCNEVSYDTFKEINNLTKTCLWFMDPLISYTEEMRIKTGLVDYACFDKDNVLEVAKAINHNSFYVCEGFDSRNDKPHNLLKENDVTFIGNLYGQRRNLLNKIRTPVNIVNDAYGSRHSVEVSKSKINLNFCTDNGASDRIYKVLAAKGFLLTDDWKGREEKFQNNQHLVIFKDIGELNEKIEFYLSNPKLAEKIAAAGCKRVQSFTRLKWAEEIIKKYEEIK